MNGSRQRVSDTAQLIATLPRRIDRELRENILPFWMEHVVDRQAGGLYGALSNDLRILNDVPRAGIICARVLWTYAAAYRTFGDQRYRDMAQHAYAYLTQVFWDETYGGVYWLVDKDGQRVNDRKHSYAQAFAIYGLSEYYAATGESASLTRALDLFRWLEAHAHDDRHGGYIEGCARDWSALADMRLSPKEPNCRKSMNTLLHIMEGYTNLLRVWDDQRLRERVRELITIFLEHVIDPQTHHFRLYFDDQWHSLADDVSYGHDIEGSWLIVEAAEVLGDADLLRRTREAAVEMAWAVYTQGLDVDNSVLYEGDAGNPASGDKHWWVQAEAVVGFYNASQISGEPQFSRAAQQCWAYIEEKFVDREHGEWFKVLNRQGVPYTDHYKVGPWECSYHHSRACFEMLRRLSP